ncbi:MAG: glycosyltransferase family 39 protein [Acidobacteriota bacterium]
MVIGVGLEEDQPSEVLDKRVFALSEAAPLVLAFTAGLICYGLFFNRGLGLSVIGYSIAPAERVMLGEVPYRDFLFNYTPGILWLNALLMKAFGATLMATRIGLLAFKLITLMTLFYVARRLTSGWAALVPVALTLTWLGHQQIFSVYPDQYLVLFALADLICMLNYDETGRLRWLLACGVAIGIVFVFKYNVGVLLLTTGALAIGLRAALTTRRFAGLANAIAVYLAGFAVVAGSLAGYLAYNHALGAMISHFMHHASEYSETRSVTLPSPSLVLPAALASLAGILVGVVVLRWAGRFFQAYAIVALAVGSIILLAPGRAIVLNESAIASVAYFPPLIFVAVSAVAISQLKTNNRGAATWWSNNGAIAITGLFALAVYLEVFPRADFYHLVRVLPPVFLFFFALLVRCLPALRETLSNRVPSPKRVALLVVTTPLIFLMLAGIQDTWEPEFDSGFHVRDNTELTIERGRGIFVEEKQAELTEGLVQLIQANSSPDDYIFSFAQRGSALYFLAARRNPTRFLWWRSVGIGNEEREGVMTMIANRRAKLIVVQDVAANKEIQDFIGDNYVHLGTVADIAVYGLRQPL